MRPAPTRLAALASLALLLCACTPRADNQALGTLERDRIVLRATAAETIVAEPVAEGSQVARGTVLLRLDDRHQRARVAAAEAGVARAEARLAELRNGARAEDIAAASARVSGARAELTDAQATWERSEQLLAQQLASRATRDRALARRDSAAAALQSAREQLLRLTNGTRPEQLAQGAAEVDAARAQLALEQRQLADLTVAATRDARLDSLPFHIGERVTRGAAVAILLADGAPYARVYVPEPLRAGLRPGDRRPVRVDGVPHTFTGRLRWIASDPAFTPYFALNASDRGRLVYLAEFDLEEGADLPTGVPVQVLLGDD